MEVKARRARWSVSAGRLLPALGGLLVVALLVRALGPQRIADRLQLAGARFGWLLGAALLSTLIYALPLGVVLPRWARPSSLSLFASRLAAAAVNAATPFLGVGGEPVRLLWLAPGARRQGAAGLFVDRGAFLCASAIFMTSGIAVAALHLPLPRVAIAVLLVAAATGLGLSLAILTLQRRRGIAEPIVRAVGRLVGSSRRRLGDRARELDARVRSLHVEHPRRFALAVALHGLGRCAAALEVYAAAQLVGMPVGLSGALVLSAVPLAIDLAFSMVPSQLGVQEGATAFLAHALGFDPAAGVAVTFLQRVRQVVFVSAGFALLALRRARDLDVGAAEDPAGQ